MSFINDLIIGDGQVGTALHKNIKDSILVGYHKQKKQGPVKFMHIAFPFDGKFISEVARYYNKYKPEFLIIHSTVQVGTTQQVKKKISPIVKICYSPIVGQHDHLTDSIKAFDKFVYGFSDYDCQVVASHLRDNGISALVVHFSPRHGELAKLLSTTRYAINIAFAQEQQRICDEFNVDYNVVVLDFEKMFNKGTLKMQQIDKVRPFVFPGHIGGHCLMPNIEILKKVFKSDFFNLIEKSNEKWSKGNK